MLGRRHGPFPIEAARDLLGLVRALYRAAQKRGEPGLTLARLEQIGRDLSEAIDLATKYPGAVGERAAWRKAEHACHRLGEVVGPFEAVERVVEAASAPILRSKTFTPKRKLGDR